ncbi:MAG: stress response translation initiation inhibitor YciH [Burkholderiaceae bacterium]
MCPVCRKAVAECACREPAAPGLQKEARVRVSRETQGRGGKAVKVVRGLTLDAAGLAALAKRLRTACGAGGTVKDGVLEVQGDHCERVIACLVADGWAVKRSGG